MMLPSCLKPTPKSKTIIHYRVFGIGNGTTIPRLDTITLTLEEAKAKVKQWKEDFKGYHVVVTRHTFIEEAIVEID